ncbi:MAG: hypothetical protein A2096_09425 [Spirochaetes bacterium GWF1_41_5]|nr:MAG: hypothetical protein A2096_09425 [Spirochaetes bacterium GWF1_41_5]HBE03779.1 cAMP-binding protein [Spirochaetia bacterium]
MSDVQLALANFNAGSYIMVEGKVDSDYFFIIRTGQVKTLREVAVAGEGNKVINPGDFFGVIGAMTGHPREESAVAASQVSLIAVKKNQFGLLIQKNTPLALKIIMSFSQKLRFYDGELTKRTLKTQHVEGDPENLFRIAEYYYKQNNHTIASYVFGQYLALNPQGANIQAAKEKLVSITAAPQQVQSGFSRTIKDGEMLFCENEPGHELFIIQTGKIKITKIINEQEILIAVLNPGDIFGEMALLENKPRNASAIAFGECQLMAVNRENFNKIVIQNPQLSTRLIQLLSERVWTVYRQLGNLLLGKPIARAFDFLLLDLQKNHIKTEPKKAHMFGFGAKEIIKFLGLDDLNGNQIIHDLLKNPKISIRNDKIYCEDIEDISKQVQFYQKMQILDDKRQAAKLKA